MHRFVKEMCIVGYATDASWDLEDGTIRATRSPKNVREKFLFLIHYNSAMQMHV